MNTRQELWLTAWTRVASASSYNNAEAATVGADACLKDFDERFPEKIQEENQPFDPFKDYRPFARNDRT